MKKTTIYLLFFFLLFKVSAQEALTVFGITYKPMISGGLINEEDGTVTKDGVDFSFPKEFGYNFGMVIRKGFNKTFSLETGITFTKRNFSLIVDEAARDFSVSPTFGVVCYEIPLLGLVYIQLDDKVFMSTSFGGGVDLFPSDVAVFSVNNQVIMEGKRETWINSFLSASIGWEYRTKKTGIFYLGGTFHRSFKPIYNLLTQYDYDYQDPLIEPVKVLQQVNGNYLTIDFRYFFNEEAEKK